MNRSLLPIIAMFYMVAIILSDIFINRMIGTDFWYTSGAVIGFPLTYTIADVVAEVYGYQFARNLIWFGFIAELIFVCLATLTIHLPHPHFWHQQNSFLEVFGNLPIVFAVGVITSPLSDFVNIYLIVKTKIYCKGRFFILRSMFSTSVGEFIDSIIVGLVLYATNDWEGNRWVIIMVIFAVKIGYSGLSALPAYLATIFLKRYENIDVFDNNITFNPFKLKIDEAVY